MGCQKILVPGEETEDTRGQTLEEASAPPAKEPQTEPVQVSVAPAILGKAEGKTSSKPGKFHRGRKEQSEEKLHLRDASSTELGEQSPNPVSAHQGKLQLRDVSSAELIEQNATVAEAKAPMAQTRRQGLCYQILSSFALTTMVSLAKYLESDTVSEEDVAIAKSSSSKLPVMEVTLIRSLVVVVFGLSVLAHDRTNPCGNPPCHPLLLLRGVLGAVGVICMLYAVVLLPLTEVMVCGLTQPIWAAILGRVVLKEKLRKVVFLALPLCLGGVMLIARPWDPQEASASFPHRGLGVAVAMAQGLCGAGAKTLVRYLGKGGYHPQVLVMYLTFFGSSISFFSLFFIQRNPVQPDPWQWCVLTLIGCSAFTAQTSSTMALRSISATEGALVNYLNLVWSEFYSLVIFFELPHPSSIAGGTLVAVCTLLLVMLK